MTRVAISFQTAGYEVAGQHSFTPSIQPYTTQHQGLFSAFTSHSCLAGTAADRSAGNRA